MRNLFKIICLLYVLVLPLVVFAQSFVANAPPPKRLQVLWRYCMDHVISDQDSATTHQFLTLAAGTADSVGDRQLKAYINYFRKCYRILFSQRYEQHFVPGDYESAVAILTTTKAWAEEQGLADIAASCEHYTGEIYFRAARYGHAFEHLLKADKMFSAIGYQKVPAAATYLYTLGFDYYQFEEYDKSLNCLLAATRYPFYIPRIELNTLNSIGLIYAHLKKWDSAAFYYRKTIEKAEAYADDTWRGIACGNLGNVFLAKGQYDSAMMYHQMNYRINNAQGAGEDGAKSALSIATVFVRQGQPDSAAGYLRSGQALAGMYINDTTERLKYRKRLLTVMIEYFKLKGNYRSALSVTDSVMAITDALQQKLDAKILSRAVEKVEMESHQTQLALLASRKSITHLRFYFITASLLLIIVISLFIFSRYRLRKNHQMQLAENERKLMALEKTRAEKNLIHAEKKLTAYLITLKEKTTIIESMDAELNSLKQTTSATDVSAITTNLDKLVSSTILTNEDWRHFRTLFEQVHPGFLALLHEKYADLSPGESRLLMLTKLDLSTREMAHMLGISVDAIRKARYRLRKKLHLDKDDSFETAVEVSHAALVSDK